MSHLLPVLLSELDSLRRPADLFDQYFGNGLLRDDDFDVYPYPVVVRAHRHYPRSWRTQAPKHSGVSHVCNDKGDSFRINLDVQQFKPEELSVKVADGFVVVEGDHEERQDEHGYVKRHFTRRYKLPEDVNPDTVASNLSSDGVLMVSAARKALPGADSARTISITQTNVPAVTATKSQGSKKQEETMELQ